MVSQLTQKSIDNLAPAAARKEIPDGLVRGLFLIIQPSGKRSWALRYRAAGRPKKLTLGPYPTIGLKAARDAAASALLRIQTGADPATEKRAARVAPKPAAPDDLVEIVASKFMAQHVRRNLRPRSVAEVTRIFDNDILPAFSARRLSEIRRAEIHDMLDSIIGRGAPVLANRTLAWFKRMCTWSIERGIIDTSPALGMRPPSIETARDRVLSDDELVAVWRAAETIGWPYGDFVKLLILSGQRRSEVANLTWRELDLDKLIWTLPAARAKNGVEHAIPLSDSVADILMSLPRIAGSEFVFTFDGEAPIKGFSVVKHRLAGHLPGGMTAWTLHDLRRSFASGCARLGVGIHIVEKLLNHTGGSFAGIVKVYQRHEFADEKAVAMQTWARHVHALVTGDAGGNVVTLRRL